MRTTTGISTEAVYIFHNMVRKLRDAYQPEYIAAIFESGKTFREEAYAEYKANRTEMPPDLGEQIPYILRLLEAMRIPVLQYAGFEADDVIGAMARRASEYTWRTVTHGAAGDADEVAYCRAQAAHYADRARRAGNP